MGQIISISVNNEVKNAACQAVTISEKRRGLPVIKNASYINAADIGKMAERQDIKVACSYDSIITESVDIPPVSSSKSRVFLLKNKMKDHLKKELEYSFAYFENHGKAEPPNINYTVYAAPVYFLKDEINISPRFFNSVKSFTFDFFAVAGVSVAVDPKTPIFHVYADKDRIIMVLSTGKKVEYYRANNVPPQVTTPEELAGFYYENINLTYLYVRQNFSNISMKVILSGKLFGDTALKDSISTFIDQPILSLTANKIVAGASDKLFNEFLIPIGHVLLRGSLDFSSDRQVGDRLFSNIVAVVNVVLLFGILLSGAYTYQNYSVYKSTQSDLDSSSRSFLTKQKQLISKLGDTDMLRYQATYLALLADRVNTPLLLLSPSQDIMDFYKFQKIVFAGRGESSTVTFEGEQKGANFASVEEFKNQVQNIINTVANNHVTANEEGSTHSLKDLQNKLNVVVISSPDLINQRNKVGDNGTEGIGDNSRINTNTDAVMMDGLLNNNADNGAVTSPNTAGIDGADNFTRNPNKEGAAQ